MALPRGRTSLRPSPNSILSATWSSQTTIGLGTVSGRAILTLGEYAIRRVEQLVYHQRRRPETLSDFTSLLSNTPSTISLSLPSHSSLYTPSATSTVPGPGEISGRAIKALGSIVVLGVDSAMARLRLASVQAMFPHKRGPIDDEGEIDIYYEILDVIRYVIYKNESRNMNFTSYQSKAHYASACKGPTVIANPNRQSGSASIIESTPSLGF